ncbi:MAG: universal stress protein [Vicingaceae bacterium]
MKTILVPTDFSDTANKARDYAIGIAKELGAQIILINTFHIPYSGASAGTLVNLGKVAQEESEKAMHNQAEYLSLNFPNLDFKTLCKPGLLLDSIKIIGKKKEVDLIVMGTTGASGILGSALGSNTSAIVGKINIPIIAVPKGSKVAYPTKIVIANDLLELGEESLFFYLKKIAAKKESMVDFLFVVKEEESADHKIERLKAKSNALQFTPQFHSINILGNQLVEDVVFEYIENKKSDLLVLISHQRGFWGDMFHKSVSKRLVKHAILPIMVLPE